MVETLVPSSVPVGVSSPFDTVEMQAPSDIRISTESKKYAPSRFGEERHL